MTERDYILASNRSMIRNARNLLSEVLACEEYGINIDSWVDAHKALEKLCNESLVALGTLTEEPNG